MTTLQLIYKIATSPEIEVVVINDLPDKSRMNAIEYLFTEHDTWKQWRVNTSLEKGTMLIFD